MIGNKADLDAQREVTFDEAKQFADENGNGRFTSYSQIMLRKAFVIFALCNLIAICRPFKNHIC